MRPTCCELSSHVARVLCVILAAHAVASAESPPPGSPAAVKPLAIDKPLIAYWTLDEQFGTSCLDASGQGCEATPERIAAPNLERVAGLFGSALRFSGNHHLRSPDKPVLGTLKQLSFSVWVMPSTELKAYREIFRKEDGDQRVLFSFQENGTILSLGLNIGGYVECDAPIDPDCVSDGAWHHCAATFDGQFMRVYLDGKPIHAIERPGVITSGGSAPGCIGSSNGGECFQGTLDELRIYAAALTAEEISRLYNNGLQAVARMSETVAAGEPQIDQPLIAHWTFNDRGGAAVIRDSAGTPPLEIAAQGVRRTRGIHGNAVDLQGTHALQTSLGSRVTELAKVSFSAWTKPSDLRGFREIFRQECPERLLFSYQENGTVLSLGLNVEGYVECDAEINPAQVMDGAWHHCAGTFDGQCLRVYLDGKEIGSLPRAGKLAFQPGAPAFLGSADGDREHFQGALDDLRIYAAALPAEQIALLYRSGLESVERFSKELQATLRTAYTRGASFAETLANTRKQLVEQGVSLDRELADALLSRLKADFPDDYANFTAWTSATPLEYLLATGNDFNLRESERMLGLAFEYKPLTEAQWAKQTPEQLQTWKAAGQLEQQWEGLKAQGDAARFSPGWLELILAAGPYIQLRPSVSEAVAPYVKPRTPETRTLSAAEAQETLERDWLHQADQNPTPARIKSEVGWTRQLAERLRAQAQGSADFAKELAQLDDLQQQAEALTAPSREIYFQVRALKRQIAFRNPVVDFNQLLLVDMPYPQGSEWPHETRHRLGYMAVPGGRLLILDGLSPAGQVKQLMPQPPLHGTFWRPDVSFDGKKVLFCFKPHNEKAFHLYEIQADGTGLVQLTDGIFDDLDPIYVPDDQHIIFSTTRGHTYVRCMPPTNAYVLGRCDRDGQNVFLISSNNEPDYLPSVMNDGRIIYTRWEYTDKPLWRAQKLWTINPDGTQVNTYWGNQSVWPDLMKDARSIPGSRRVMFTGSAHHNWFSGSVGIINPDDGYNFPDGLWKVTADVAWPEVGNGPVDPIECPDYHASGHYPAYYSPYPLSEQDFLVSAQRGGKFLLYLMDVYGNRELIYEGVNNVFHAMPLKPRGKPPLVADRVAWPNAAQREAPQGGVILSGNVYQGAPAELRSKARFLRVLHIDPKTYTYWNKRPALSTGPVVSVVQSEGVKRVLGTVAIESDGSVAFRAPPGKAIHFQLLDENYRALQTMRSFVGLMPGERRGCLGCHESHSRTPQTDMKCLALSKEPQRITPPPWGEDTVSYPRYVQPVLNQYCGKCHQGDGEARKTLDLTAKPGFLGFAEPYFLLTGHPSWGQPYKTPEKPSPGWGIADMLMVEGYSTTDPAAYRTPKPMTALSYRSRLIELCASGKHYDVKVDPVNLQKLIAWVDAMCPYRGDEEVRELDDPVFPGVDWLSIRPRIRTAPNITRPGPVDGFGVK